MHVRWRLTKARHAAISFEVVEWSEQSRPVTSVWLGAIRRSVQVRLCTSGCKSGKMFGVTHNVHIKVSHNVHVKVSHNVHIKLT